MKFLQKYGKTIVAGAAAIVYAFQAALSDNTITTVEWVSIITVALGAVGVFYAPAITNTKRPE